MKIANGKPLGKWVDAIMLAHAHAHAIHNNNHEYEHSPLDIALDFKYKLGILSTKLRKLLLLLLSDQQSISFPLVFLGGFVYGFVDFPFCL